jgi:hypothetical protein
MNPFTNCDFSKPDFFNYTDFVLNQVSNTSVNESKMVDFGSKDVQTFRMTLNRLINTKIKGFKFKTKVASDGSLWVMRVQ